MRTYLSDQETRKKGFTLMELLAVVMIIAILCAIAIPSLITVNRSLKFKQMNDYAESIFMAAQANLTKMKREGRLGELTALQKPDETQATANGTYKLTKGMSHFPDADWNDAFRYTVGGKKAFDLVLPPNSVDASVRNQNILIEYNPVSGNVYSVFFSSQDGFNIRNEYISGLPRDDEDARRDLFLGYYQGSDDTSTEVVEEDTNTIIEFENGEKGIVKVKVTISDEYNKNPSDMQTFLRCLEADLVVEGEFTPELTGKTPEECSFMVSSRATAELPSPELIKRPEIVDGKYVEFDFVLDSLETGKSFASRAAIDPSLLLTDITAEDQFKILPGDNVSLTAHVFFTPEKGKSNVDVQNGVLSGVNPIFESLTDSGAAGGKYVVSIKNGRNLQNLNIIAPTIAKKVDSINFTEHDLNWNDTLEAYGYNPTSVKNGAPANKAEFPGRALPYFVPIYQKDLSGVPAAEKLGGRNFLTGTANEKLPAVHGAPKDKKDEGTRIHSLKINAEKCRPDAAPNFYATEGKPIDYTAFTGLFGYINTTIDNLKIVNPVVVGASDPFNLPLNPNSPAKMAKGKKKDENKGNVSNARSVATGALFGAGGRNTQVTNCAVYLERKAPGYDPSLKETKTYNGDGWLEADCYGVSGYGAVGGLAGYCYSDRVTNAPLDNHLEKLSFYKSFAAVPVRGEMGKNGGGDVFPDGVGGFVGSASQSNCYSCYASGTVYAVGGYLGKPKENEFFDDDCDWYEWTEVPKLDKDGNQVYDKDDNGNIEYDDPEELDDLEDYVDHKLGPYGKHDPLWDLGAALDDVDDDPEPDDIYDDPEAEPEDLWPLVLGYEFTPSCNGLTSRGAGGFVGTSQGTRYANCFATGRVEFWNMVVDADVNKKENEFKEKMELLKKRIEQAKKHPNDPLIDPNGIYSKLDGIDVTVSDYTNYSEFARGAGSFVGVMSYDGPATGQTGLFESCYALGFALNRNDATDPGQELFAGATAVIGDASSKIFTEDILKEIEDLNSDLMLPVFGSDYYRILAPHYYQTKKMPNNGHLYFFKDSFQYSRKGEQQADSTSNECAVFADWDVMENLIAKHTDKDWQTERIEKFIKKYNVGRYADYFAKTPDLDKAYRTEYSKGFNTSYQFEGMDHAKLNWEKSYDPSTTHPYTTDPGFQCYPFIKLVGLDYYGDWPTKPRDAGLAYYEVYEDGTWGFYFESDNTVNEKLRNEGIVVDDGYAVVSPNFTEASVEVEGKKFNLERRKDTYAPGDAYGAKEFNVFPLPDDCLEITSSDATKFYTKITINGKGTAPIFCYYNPNVAKSQVNPAFHQTTVPYPAADPEEISIRSARQFYRLSTMDHFWGSYYHYYQEMNIDATKYQWSNARKAHCMNAQPIGTEAAPFNGTYIASNPQTVVGFLPGNSGLFGMIGTTGKVSNVTFKAELPAKKAAKGETVGLIAGSCQGTLDHINLELTTAQKAAELNLNAAQNAGLLAGSVTGTANNCNVKTGANVNLTIDAKANAGGMIGYAAKAQGADANTGKIDSCELVMMGNLTLKGSNCGGYVGLAENADFNVPRIILGSQSEDAGLTMTCHGQLNGGFAGKISGGLADTASVQIYGNVTADNDFGGFAGKAENLTVNSLEAFLNHNVNAEKMLAGMIADAVSVKADNCIVSIYNGMTMGYTGLTGKTAAGIIGTMDDASAVTNSGVAFAVLGGNGMISGTDQAAGFALTANGSITGCMVSGHGTINSSGLAAGFAGEINSTVSECQVTPVPDNLAADYEGDSLAGLQVQGKTSAGFAGTVNGTVNNSMTLCTLSGEASGFADTNKGKIDGCMANIALTGGHAFAKNNPGTVSNSYGWYDDANAQKADSRTVLPIDGNYTSCYFGALSPYEELKTNDKGVDENVALNIVVFDSTGKAETASGTRILTRAATVDALNGSDTAAKRWSAGGSSNAYPFAKRLGKTYYYPMLRDHFGDWADPPFPSFGVVYYEAYDTASGYHKNPNPQDLVYWIHLEDIIQDGNALEEQPLSFRAYFQSDANGNLTMIPESLGRGKPYLKRVGDHDEILDDIKGEPVDYGIQKDKDIYEAGYSIFSKEITSQDEVPFIPQNLIKPNDFNQKLDRKIQMPMASRYRFYNLQKSGSITMKELEKGPGIVNNSFTFNTWFGDTIDNTAKDYDYEIRSSEHFNNINKTNTNGVVTGKFSQSWDILNQDGKNTDFSTIKKFNGIYDGNDRITVVENGKNSWIETIPGGNSPADGVIHDLSIKVTNQGNKPLIDNTGKKVTFDSIELGSVNGDWGVIRDASHRVEIGKLSVAGNVDGILFQNISGNGIRIDDLYIGGNLHGGLIMTLVAGNTGGDKDSSGVDIGNMAIKGTISSTANSSGGCLIHQSTGAPFLCGIDKANGQKTGSMELGNVNSPLFGAGISEVRTSDITIASIGENGCISKTLNTPFIADSITITGNVNGNLFGTVNAKCVAPQLTATGNLNNHLFNTVTVSAELKLGTINVSGGKLRSALIGTAEGQTFDSLNVTVNKSELTGATLQNPNKKYAGIFADTMNNCTVKNSVFTANKVRLIGGGKFGVIAGKASNCRFDGNTVNKPKEVTRLEEVQTVSLMSLAEPEVFAFGCIAGENEGGKITNNTIDGLDLNLSGEPDVCTIAGTLAGINSGEISGNTVKDSTITYIQPAGADSAQIGGLVGQMNGGSIEDQEVSGKILLKQPEAAAPAASSEDKTPAGTDREYYIGGAVGAEGTHEPDQQAIYSNVKSDVSIDPEWADPKDAPQANDPAGQGSVGMFVGYVNDGIFDSCSSTAQDNEKYGFLGEINTEIGMTPADTFAQKASEGPSLMSLETEVNPDTLTSVGKVRYSEYGAMIHGCTYQLKGESFQQSIETHETFYTLNEGTSNQAEGMTPVSAAIAEKKGLLLKDLAAADTEGAYVPTFFYGKAEDGSLQRLAVWMEDTGDGYRFELAFMDGSFYDEMTIPVAELDTAVWNKSPVFTYSHNLIDGGHYLIVNAKDQMLTVTKDGNVAWEPKAESAEKIEDRMLWIASRKNVDSVSWQNATNTAYFLGENLNGLAGNNAIAFQLAGDGTIRLGSSDQVIKLVKVDVVKVEKESGYENIGSSQVIKTQKLDKNGKPVGDAVETAVAPAAPAPANNTESTTETSAANQAAEAPKTNGPAAENTKTDPSV